MRTFGRRDPARAKPRRRKFNVEEYHRMAEAGILSEEDNVELIEGEVMEKHPVGKRRFTADEYLRMAEAGILHENDRVELIEGEILDMAAVGNRHLACVNRLNRLFMERLGRAVVVHVQNPVRLSEHSEPEPDVALLRPRADFYAGKRPAPEDVLLLIEVSDTTLEYDREVKVPLYARAGVPEVWLVDLAGERVLTHTRPEGEAYAEVGQVGRGGSVTSRTVAGLALAVDDILG